jgi:gamma-glutamyltranspeptidase/glutathione hydrolase
VGVPGLLAGHASLLERFGTRSLRDVLAPALRLAREGFAVDQNYCSGSRDLAAAVRKYPSLEPGAQAMQDLFLLKGAELKPGAVLRQPDMARTLEILGREGANAFYRGAIGEAIVRTVRRHGGIMTMEDLGTYRPVWRQPIRVNYRGREVVLMPPASSGGICIAQTLQILEQWDLGRIRRDDPALAAHLTIEALKHAFADRARYHGDADQVEVPVKKLTSRDYARELAGRIREDAAQPVDSYGWTVGDDDGTSHYSIVDAEGNVVAATETINTVYGALLMAEGTGIVLNNEMDDFTAEPGKVNAYGLRQSAQNAVAPGERPLSCMSPTIVVDKGRPLLSVGASGGPRIITATLQVLLNVLDYELPLEQAVGGPRFHHQWQPDTVNRNAYAADDPVIRGLAQRGHVISDVRRDAVVQAIRIEPGRLTGASDPRKGGRPAGY